MKCLSLYWRQVSVSLYTSEMKQETDNLVNVNVRFWDHNTNNNINLCAKEKAQQFYETFLSEESRSCFSFFFFFLNISGLPDNPHRLVATLQSAAELDRRGSVGVGVGLRLLQLLGRHEYCCMKLSGCFHVKLSSSLTTAREQVRAFILE